MQIVKGKIHKAVKVVIYGVEGIGKSTLVSQFPDPLFIDTEDGTHMLDVSRFPRPTSWTMLAEQILYVKTNPTICKTLVIDTADWAEKLCIKHICTKAKVDGIENFGYGKGYVYLEEEFGRLLNLLQDLIDIGINVVLTAHAEIKKVEQPEEIGGYDHWQMKLEKKTMPLLREWCDVLLFANYKTLVVNVDNQGATKGKNKAQGGQRTLYANHKPWWDAKNRHGFPDEMPMTIESLSRLFARPVQTAQTEPVAPIQSIPTPPPIPETPEPISTASKTVSPIEPITVPEEIPKELRALMVNDQIKAEEIQEAVADRGIYPKDTPIQVYDPKFIQGVLVATWPKVRQAVLDKRIPFDL